MTSRMGDEFAHIFDGLTTRDFSPMRTLTYPSENTSFAEFVETRIEMARLAYEPEKILMHMALSNGVEVRQLAPVAHELAESFIERVTLNARDMTANSLFFCNLVRTLDDPAGDLVVIWLAGHIEDGEQSMRMGVIAIERDHLGECAEGENPELIAAAGNLLRHVLMP